MFSNSKIFEDNIFEDKQFDDDIFENNVFEDYNSILEDYKTNPDIFGRG